MPALTARDKEDAMIYQLSIPLTAEPMTLKGAVLAILSDGLWRSAQEIQDELARRYDKHSGTACITARIRDLRKPEHGGYEIDREYMDGVHKYRLIKGMGDVA